MITCGDPQRKWKYLSTEAVIFMYNTTTLFDPVLLHGVVHGNEVIK